MKKVILLVIEISVWYLLALLYTFVEIRIYKPELKNYLMAIVICIVFYIIMLIFQKFILKKGDD